MPARHHESTRQNYSINLTGQPEDKLASSNGYQATARSIQIEYVQIDKVHTIFVTIEAEWDTGGGGIFHWHRTGGELADVPMWLKQEIGRNQPRWSKARIPGQQ